MEDKEGEKEKENPDSMPGLMTRGRLQKLQGITNPKPTNRRYLEDEFITPKAKAQMQKGESHPYGKVMGKWVPRPIWPPGQMMRMGNPQKIMPNNQNYMITPYQQQMAHQLAQQMSQMPPQMTHMTMPQPGMPVPPNKMQTQHGMQTLSPKMAQMMPMMMRPGTYGPKGHQQGQPMPKSMRPVPVMPGMQNMNPMMYAQMMQRMAQKSPPYVRNAMIKAKMTKTSVSPKNMETFLNDNSSRDEKIDLNEQLREEIKKILNQELDRINDLYTDRVNFEKKGEVNLLSKKELNGIKENSNNSREAEEKEEVKRPFTYVNEDEIVEVLIERFKQVLEVLWSETKKCHEYSLDETYIKLSTMIKAEEEENNTPRSRKRGKKKTKPELVVTRNYSSLKTLFMKRDQIEKLMASYRTASRTTGGNNYFTFSSFNTGPIHNEGETVNEGEEEDLFLKKAMEYADVASNQKNLANIVTALDFRAALAGDSLLEYLPGVFRETLMEAVSYLHFDLGTPPPMSPKMSKQEPEQDAVLNKVYDTLQSFQNSDTPPKQAPMMPGFAPFVQNFGAFNPDERMKEMMAGAAQAKRPFNVPPGMPMFPGVQPMHRSVPGGMPPSLSPSLRPNMPPTMPPNMQPNMPPNMPPNMAPNMVPGMPPGMQNLPVGAGKGVQLQPGPKGFSIPPGMMPPQMVMPNMMPPHMANNQFYKE
ncbi:heat shock protein 70 [Theileria orientalis strain Shintoku]|uniref:Heat shock protein 70 n=1 Tax=Theileria orientalis strain Shintoku TaxID=869250 RepID=J7MBV2_THEOR|nr:heat shock protein 70 [Theileria orientalis strain Shintoku]BAM38622.1 heat shock protein 70 [Theileria orientalis strain Shintoku]|eukprot:XP_009688923.1 heat shock protein 70 [Theileria orientalis strain Shintoku]